MAWKQWYPCDLPIGPRKHKRTKALLKSLHQNTSKYSITTYWPLQTQRTHQQKPQPTVPLFDRNIAIFSPFRKKCHKRTTTFLHVSNTRKANFYKKALTLHKNKEKPFKNLATPKPTVFLPAKVTPRRSPGKPAKQSPGV